MINPLGARSTPDAAQTSAIKGWVAAVFALPDDATVMVSELRCTEPGCPPLETVIVVLATASPPQQYKLHKALAAVTKDDITALVEPQA